MTTPQCPHCRTSASWMLRAARWVCAACGRRVDAPPIVRTGQGDYAVELHK